MLPKVGCNQQGLYSVVDNPHGKSGTLRCSQLATRTLCCACNPMSAVCLTRARNVAISTHDVPFHYHRLNDFHNLEMAINLLFYSELNEIHAGRL